MPTQIECTQCHLPFVLSTDVVEFFKERGFPTPDICGACHAKVIEELKASAGTDGAPLGDLAKIKFPRCGRCRKDIETIADIEATTYPSPDGVIYDAIILSCKACRNPLPGILIAKQKKIVTPGSYPGIREH